MIFQISKKAFAYKWSICNRIFSIGSGQVPKDGDSNQNSLFQMKLNRKKDFRGRRIWCYNQKWFSRERETV